MSEIILPHKEDLKIEKMYAFISQDPKGNEGIVGINMNGTWFPLCGADMKQVDQFRALVQKLSVEHKKKIILSTFSVREDIEFYPRLDL